VSRPASIDDVVQQRFTVTTRGRGFSEISARIAELVSASDVRIGIANIFTTHTSCSLLISENADPAVRRDMERWFARAVPDGDPMFEHDAEGPDDMPSHIRATLTGVTLTVPVSEGKLQLGTWQGIYLWEHRTHPHERQVVVTVLGR
jgi:secondary thiamine-phosphate synthase enzyme